MPIVVFVYQCQNKTCGNIIKYALMKREQVVCAKCGSKMELVGIERKEN